MVCEQGKLSFYELDVNERKYLAKGEKLSKNTVKDMAFLVFKIATPCVIIKSFIEVIFTADYL